MEDVPTPIHNESLDEGSEELTIGGHCIALDTPEGMARHSCMFAPKSLVLVSRLDYFETFRVSVSSYSCYILVQKCPLFLLCWVP